MTKNAMYRIGFLMHGISYGGATRSLFLLLKGLNRQPHDYEIIIYSISAHSGSILNQLKKYVLDVKFVKVKTLYINQVHKDSYYKYLKRKNSNSSDFIDEITQDNLDILHINTSVFPHILKPIKTETNIKVVVHIRELLPKYGETRIGDYMIEMLNKYADILLCISPNEASRFDLEKVVVVPNPFDFSKIYDQDSNWKNDFGLSSNTVIISMFSNFHYMKGHLQFLESLKELESDQINIPYKFVIVGVKQPTPLIRRLIKRILGIPDYRSKVLKYLTKNKLQDKVILHPYTNDVFKVYNGTDIVVRPALSGDPWGRDVIEAMAMKKPIIATGTSDFYVKSGINGYLVPPNDSKRLSGRVKQLIQDPEKRSSMGLAGYKMVKNRCDINEYVTHILKIYSNLVH